MTIDIAAMEAQVKLDEAALNKPAEETKAPVIEEKSNVKETKEVVEKVEVENGQEEAKEEIKADDKDSVNKARERIARKKKLEEERERFRLIELENAKLKGQLEVKQEPVKQEAEEEMPDKDIDPVGFALWENKQLKKQVEEINKKNEEIERNFKLTAAEKLWLQTDNEMANKNPVYKNSMAFLRTTIREALKQNYPNASMAQIEEAAKQAEYSYVGNIAKSGLDIEAYFVGEAIKSGYNPYQANNKPETKQTNDELPKTNMQEVRLHKQQAGGVASITEGAGKGRMTAQDIAKLSTMDDIFKINTKDIDWDKAAAELARNG